MADSRTLFLACAATAALASGLSLALAGQPGLAVLALLIGLLWVWPEVRRSERRLAWLGHATFSSAWFGCLALAAAVGLAGGAPGWLALACIAAGLAAWDLSAFRRRINPGQGAGLPPGGDSSAGKVSHSRAMPDLQIDTPERAAFEKVHLRALGWTLLSGLGAALLIFIAARLWQFPARLDLGLGLGLAWIIGLLVLARLIGKN